MGEVFEAEHVGLKTRLVVKLLHGRYAGKPDILDRMRVEAQALALLNHPNIVRVVDFGATDDERTFLVMERLYGRTLAKEQKERQSLPALEAIAITREILAGLAAAHDAGMIHRDIKLDNIFLCDPSTEGRGEARGERLVKLLDFGVIKLLPEGASAEQLARSPAPLAYPTATGFTVGSPRFIAPEQALGTPVDARCDVYAVGMILYILLAGRGPFDHINATQNILQAHIATSPEPPSVFAEAPIPPELEAAVLRALAKRPEERFPTALAFSEELAAIAARLKAANASSTIRRWASTEPLQQRPSAPTPLPATPPRPSDARPAAQPTSLLGKATEKIPNVAAIVNAQRRAPDVAPQLAPPLAPRKEAPPAFTERRSPSPPTAPASSARAPHERLVFILAAVLSAIIVCVATAVLLVHLLG